MDEAHPHTGRFREALDILSAKLREDEDHLGVSFPYVTGTDGRWRTMLASVSAGYQDKAWSHGNWFCGFWIGLLLAAYLHRGEQDVLGIVAERMRLIAPRADDPNTHDIGFIFHNSAVPAAYVTGDTAYVDLAIRAADRLRRRVITTGRGAYLSSWGPLSDQRGRSSSAIDTMANLPLLYWAAEASGDGSFKLVGETHALATADAFVRPDMSTYHAVEYDVISGERIRGYTFQGFSDEFRLVTWPSLGGPRLCRDRSCDRQGPISRSCRASG